MCLYVKNDIPFKRWSKFENDRLECLWLCLRPKHLPGPFSGIVIAVIYHPPCLSVNNHNDLNEYLINILDLISKFILATSTI